MHCSFPRLGQLIKFAFDVTGVLPRKRGGKDGLTELEKKRIQKQLGRLVSEDGNLVDRCSQLIHELAFITAGTLTNQKASLVMGEIAMDILEVYTSVIRDDGTYLSETDSLRWFCRAYAIPRLVLSIEKNLLRFNLASEGFVTPSEADWFLPTVNQAGVVWPLAKVMHWAYEVSGTSQTHFHYPGKNVQVACVENQQNLENAADWINGKRIPSWPALRWNFSQSFDHLASVENEKYRRETPEKVRESIYYALFLARLSTSICKTISDNYGLAFLEQLVDQFKRHRTWLAKDLDGFRKVTAGYIAEKQVPAIAVDDIWWIFSEDYWAWFSARAVDFAHTLNHLLRHYDYGPLPKETVAELTKSYGEHAVQMGLEKLAVNGEFEIPDGFQQALHDGFNLKSDSDCSDKDIDQFVIRLRRNNLETYLGWMEPWLRAAIRYRSEDYLPAFTYIKIAFEQAKYCAGKNQYQLVNQFIELAAKNDCWKSFKKGIEWARYLGLSVRWLRDDEPTEENLRGVFDLMRVVRYGQL